MAENYLREGGSITVTSGVLAIHPMPGSAAISMIHTGLEGFVRAAALEMPRRIRINDVSPPWVKETLVKFGVDPTHRLPCVAGVEGAHQGEISSHSNSSDTVRLAPLGA